MSEKTRVRLTLLEYGNKSFLRIPGAAEGTKQSEKQAEDQDQLEQEEVFFNGFLLAIERCISKCFLLY